MNTIKIERPAKTEEIEVELPYYSIGIAYAYAVVEEKKAIVVEFGVMDTSIKVSTYCKGAFAEYQTQCTPQEFWNKYREISGIMYDDIETVKQQIT